MKRRLMLAVALILAAPAAVQAQEAASEEEAWLDLMRADIRAEKTSIVRQAMNLNAEQLTAFEPLYAEYEGELAMIWDSHLELLDRYAATYQNMDDATANELAEWAMELEVQRVQLLRETFRAMSDAIGPVNAARFIQVENRIDLLVNLEITSRLPLVQVTN